MKLLFHISYSAFLGTILVNFHFIYPDISHDFIFVCRFLLDQLL